MNQDNELADSWVSVDTHEDNSFTSFNSLGSSFPSTPASPRKERGGPVSPSLFQAALNRLQEKTNEELEPLELSKALTEGGEKEEGEEKETSEQEMKMEEEVEGEGEGEEKLKSFNLDTYDMVHLTQSMEEEITTELEKLRRVEEKIPLKKDAGERLPQKGEKPPPEDLEARKATDPPPLGIPRQPSSAPTSSSSSSSSSTLSPQLGSSLPAPLPAPLPTRPSLSAYGSPSSSSSLSSSPAPLSSSLRPPLHSWNPTSPESLMEEPQRLLPYVSKLSQAKGLRHRKTPSEPSRIATPAISLSESPFDQPSAEPDSDFVELRINRQKLSMTFLLSALFVTHLVAFSMGVICDRKLLLA